MKLLDILIEANISNLDKVQPYLNSIWTQKVDPNDLVDPAFKNWWKTIPIKYIKAFDPATRNDSFSENFKLLSNVSTDSPEWLKTALAKGDKVWEFEPTSKLTEQLTQILHWMIDLELTVKLPIESNDPFRTEKTQKKQDADTTINGFVVYSHHGFG